MDQLTQQISDLYQSGLSIEIVGVRVGRSRFCVGQRLRKAGITRRSLRKYSFNEDFFEIIDTEEKAYWLGFMGGDGHIRRRKLSSGELVNSGLGFSQKFGDSKTLEFFKKHINATNLIHRKKIILKGKVYWRATIVFNSKKLVNDLLDKGMTPVKSLTMKPPKNIPGYLICHWIRGYFDADGCVGNYKASSGCYYKRVSIVGTEEVLRFIQNRLGGIGNIYLCSNSSIFHLQVAKQRDVERFRRYIYKDATVFLERKEVKFGGNK